MAEEEKVKGSVCWSTGDYPQAIVHFSKALQLNPDQRLQLILYSNRSAAYHKLKDYCKALEDGSQCISIDKNWTKGYVRKGDAQHSIGDLRAALNTYGEGLRIDANDQTLKDKRNLLQNIITKSSNTPAGRSGTFFGKLLVKLTTYFRVALLISALFVVIPFSSINTISFKMSALLESLVGLATLYINHGLPGFNTAYLQAVVTDSYATRLLLAGILLFTKPYLLAVAPLFLSELSTVTSTIFDVSYY